MSPERTFEVSLENLEVLTKIPSQKIFENVWPKTAIDDTAKGGLTQV